MRTANRIAIIAAAFGLVLLGVPLTAGEVVPAPGHLLVLNLLTPTPDGSCEGRISFKYGFLPEQRERGWTAIPDASCNVEVKQVGGNAPFWRSVGTVEVEASAIARVTGDYQNDLARVQLTTIYDYPVLPCSIDGIDYDPSPELEETNNLGTWSHDGAHISGNECEWHTYTTWGHCAIGCGYVYLDAVAYSTHSDCDIRPSGALNHYGPWCNPGTPDYLLPNTPPYQTLGVVNSGLTGTFNIGSG